ncbi:hypothetical protein EYF80_027563 [Liparis tanakae]|uniref:Uncharacterized protein n=1 Tax=Liparis tanakae TaxID=230148 RepID=A0A4Z2HB00_9TELE|nr:hypothetical protein EYF80_027563 [Liparis tanakae]
MWYQCCPGLFASSQLGKKAPGSGRPAADEASRPPADRPRGGERCMRSGRDGGRLMQRTLAQGPISAFPGFGFEIQLPAALGSRSLEANHGSEPFASLAFSTAGEAHLEMSLLPCSIQMAPLR